MPSGLARFSYVFSNCSFNANKLFHELCIKILCRLKISSNIASAICGFCNAAGMSTSFTDFNQNTYFKIIAGPIAQLVRAPDS